MTLGVSCGTLHAMKLINLKGQRFGRWLVLKKARHRGAQITWTCRCDCGKTKNVLGCTLRRGESISCGCITLERMTTHGHFTAKGRSPEHMIWAAMIQRCHNPKNPAFKDYGGRGISVCPEWRGSFISFFDCIGQRPNKDLTLDRINNDGNYEPNNVRWATRSEQNFNQRRSKRLHL